MTHALSVRCILSSNIHIYDRPSNSEDESGLLEGGGGKWGVAGGGKGYRLKGASETRETREFGSAEC